MARRRSYGRRSYGRRNYSKRGFSSRKRRGRKGSSLRRIYPSRGGYRL